MAAKTKKPKVLTVGQLLYICQQFKGDAKNSPVYMTDFDGEVIFPCFKTTKGFSSPVKGGALKPVELIIFADVEEDELTTPPLGYEDEVQTMADDDECSDVCDITGRMSPNDRKLLVEHVKKQMSADCVADDLLDNKAITYATRGDSNGDTGSAT